MNLRRPLRLRDFIVTDKGWIFSVVRYDCLEEVKGILRYVPSRKGDRERDGERYLKVEYRAALCFLERHAPSYFKEQIHAVPLDSVSEVLKPELELSEIAARDQGIADITKALSRAVSRDSIGVTGSWLCGLEGKDSDVDLVVYGDDFFKARDELGRLKCTGSIEKLPISLWKKVYHKRASPFTFEEFLIHEERKGNRGAVGGTYFDLLYARDYNDLDVEYIFGKQLGHVKVISRVNGTDHPFDNPGVYFLDHQSYSKVVVYTHTYSGQAEIGELVEISGMVEEGYESGVNYLVVGTTRNDRKEYIKSLDLIGSTRSQLSA